ncbi:site-specific integrase [Ktedonobacter racemifer]|uniref:Integrase domain protein SAM domain protein n=1 Tax=Ktedonobacter racemifer DSM 44963 TaxID=485913 RepID=D6U384_KTERA|nr:site-specific integrase [Ktedonobacter racemifer]EFH81088.1 integrase domain protein SAM domain protein [Ktedonobacter racemifer DSM 44963]
MFDRIVEQYLRSLPTAGKATTTQRAVRSDLLQFCTWWEHVYQRPFDLTQVGERDLRAWKVVRQQDEGSSPETIMNFNFQNRETT